MNANDIHSIQVKSQVEKYVRNVHLTFIGDDQLQSDDFQFN